MQASQGQAVVDATGHPEYEHDRHRTSGRSQCLACQADQQAVVKGQRKEQERVSEREKVECVACKAQVAV